MVDFTKFDIALLFTLALAVFFMSFIFPAAGLTGDSDKVNESDIPEFNISADRYDFAGDFPESPGTPTSGTLSRYENKTIIDEHRAWLDRPSDNGTSIELTNFSGDMKVNFHNWSNGNSVANDLYNITEEGQEIRHANESWGIKFTVESYQNHAEPNMSAIVDWEVTESPQDDEGGGLAALPVIGWLFGAGEYLALTLAYIGDIIFWAVGMTVEIALAAVGITFSVLTFFVDVSVWLFTTFNDIVSNTNAVWAKALVAMIPLLAMLEFAKLAYLGIRAVPFT